jgi:hypothetical protein
MKPLIAKIKAHPWIAACLSRLEMTLLVLLGLAALACIAVFWLLSHIGFIGGGI